MISFLLFLYFNGPWRSNLVYLARLRVPSGCQYQIWSLHHFTKETKSSPKCSVSMKLRGHELRKFKGLGVCERAWKSAPIALWSEIFRFYDHLGPGMFLFMWKKSWKQTFANLEWLLRFISLLRVMIFHLIFFYYLPICHPLNRDGHGFLPLILCNINR